MTCRSTLPSGQIVFDPRGERHVNPFQLASRLPLLKNCRLGVLDNSKWNASRLLRHVVKQLEHEISPIAIRHYTKPSFSRLAPGTLLDQIAEETDAVVTAIGD